MLVFLTIFKLFLKSVTPYLFVNINVSLLSIYAKLSSLTSDLK